MKRGAFARGLLPMYYGFDPETKSGYFRCKGLQFFYHAASAREGWYIGYRMYRARRVPWEDELD